MSADENEGVRVFRGFRRKDRIDTQIHRRRTVQALSPLQSEWESSQTGPASEAKNKAKEMRRVMPNRKLPQTPTRSS
jgi:hypothetical protein